MATSDFTSLPILSVADARDPARKPQFLDDLRNALLHVGFLYLSDTGIADELFERVAQQTHLFFDESVLPLSEKERIEMKNQKSFLGWSRLDNETTAGHADHREQLDLSTEHPVPGPDKPAYHNLLAPNQWPSETHLPDFKPVFQEYMRELSALSIFFTSLIAEAIGLPPTAFEQFFDANQQHKLKVVKYPEAPTASSDPLARQGVGPHKDSMLSSFLFQVTPQRGLQVQNLRGAWIDAAPRPRTLVVAFGQGLEALTGGVCASTTHRVLSPRRGEGARFSVPFFQGVSYDAEFARMRVPESVAVLKRRAVAGASGPLTSVDGAPPAADDDDGDGASERSLSQEWRRKDDVEFTFRPGQWTHLGEATLANRVKSHPDVGARWYPELLAQIRAQQAQAR